MIRLPIPGLPGWEVDSSGAVFAVDGDVARRVAPGPDGLVVARVGNAVTSFRVADVVAVVFPTTVVRPPRVRRRLRGD